MSLTSLRVYPDWQARLWRSQAQDRSIWNVALATFALSILLLSVGRVTPMEPDPGSLLADGMVKALYLTIGLMVLAHRTDIPKRWLASGGLLVAVGMLLGEYLAQPIDEDAANRTLFSLQSALLAILLVVPSWSILAMVFFRRGKEHLPGRTGARVLHGLVAGGVIVALMYVSQSFTGPAAMFALPPVSLFVRRVAYAVGIQSVAEELFFRGIVFRHLYMQRQKGFWTAAFVTLLLNLVVYAIEMPPSISPLGVALQLTAAGTMIVVNTQLYAREASLIGPTVSNAIFQISFFALGMG